MMQASAEKIWALAQEHLRSMLSSDIYNLWFAPLRVSSTEEGVLILEVANDFCEVWLKDNYMDLLQDVIALASGRQIPVKFRVTGTPSQHAQAAVVPRSAGKSKSPEVAPESNNGAGLDLS